MHIIHACCPVNGNGYDRACPPRRGARAAFLLAFLIGVTSSALASNPSGSRLGPHLLGQYTTGCQQMIAAHPRVIKILDTGGAMLSAVRDYKAGTPDGIVVLRIYTAKTYNVGQDPAWAANDFWTTVLAPQINGLSSSDKALIDYVEGPNEGDSTPTWGSLQDAQWYNTFWVNLAPLIGNAGFKPCAFSIAVGNPPGNQAYMNSMIDAIVPALRACDQYGGGWSYHSYTLLYTTDVNTEIYYSLRYRQYYDRFDALYPDLSDLPLILTEGGVDGQSGSGGPGWKAHSAAAYQNWLAWFDQRMMEDPYVIGCTLFQSGEFGGWFSFELEPIAGWLANHIANTQPPGPVISLSPGTLTPSTTEGQNPSNQSFTVANAGTGTLSYSISDNASWLSCSPSSGTSTGEQDTITVSYSAGGLSAGTHNATITVSDPNASNNPRTVAVTLTVNSSMNNNTPTGTNIALAATQYATDSNYNASYAGDKAKDGVVSAVSKWCSNGNAPPHWIAFDLGGDKTVNGFIVRMAGAAGELAGFNFKNFKFQSGTSISGPWTDECTVDNSAQANTVARSYTTPRTLRYVRLYITDCGIDNYARLPEFEIYSPKLTVTENFTSVPSWTSSFDASWGNAATWSAVSGGQSGNCLQATRGGTGSSAKVKVYDISPNQSYTISVYMRCPSSGDSYWRECFYRLGSHTAQDFDNNGGAWTEIKKFSNTGANGNGDAWVQYSKNFNSGSNTQISVGFKTGNAGGTAPTIKWDTLSIQ